MILKEYRALIVCDNESLPLTDTLRELGFQTYYRILKDISGESKEATTYDLIFFIISSQNEHQQHLECIRLLKKQHNTPITVLSDRYDRDFRTEVFTAGATDYILLPLIRQELLIHIKTFIERELLVSQLQKQTLKTDNFPEKNKGITKTQTDVHLSRITFLEQLVQRSLTGMWIHEDYVIRYINDRYAQMLGYETKEIIGTVLWDYIHPAEIARFKDRRKRRTMGESSDVHYEIRMIHKNGEIRWMELFTSSILFQEQTLRMGNMIDITGRKKAEEELKRNQKILKETSRIAGVGGWELDVETNTLSWTDEVYRIHELNRDYIPTVETAIDFYHPDYKSLITKAVNSAIEDGEPFALEAKIITGKGNNHWVFAKGKAVKKDGSTVKISGTFQDINEQKKAEEELQKLRNYLSNIIDSMPSLLVGIDSHSTITMWNAEAQRQTGISSEEANGQPLYAMIPYLSSEKSKIAEAIRTGQLQLDPKRKRYSKDKRIYENITIYPLVTDGIEGAVIRVDNVTEYVELEETITQSDKMLSVGGLAAGMAHEINNPLGGMIQTAQVIMNRLTDYNIQANIRAAEEAGISLDAVYAYMEKRKIIEMLNKINESGKRASGIVHNMLSFARMDDNGPVARRMPDLVDKCIELCGLDYNLSKKYDFKHIKIIRKYEKDLPEILCETGKIQQVIMNILRNGAEIMSENQMKPQLTIRIYLEKNLNLLRLEIEDNGPGMTEEIRKRIFEPFFTTKKVGEGTGLGLSISYFIITENHKGEMYVRSEPGKGSTFIIGLPLVRK